MPIDIHPLAFVLIVLAGLLVSIAAVHFCQLDGESVKAAAAKRKQVNEKRRAES